MTMYDHTADVENLINQGHDNASLLEISESARRRFCNDLIAECIAHYQTRVKADVRIGRGQAAVDNLNGALETEHAEYLTTLRQLNESRAEALELKATLLRFATAPELTYGELLEALFVDSNDEVVKAALRQSEIQLRETRQQVEDLQEWVDAAVHKRGTVTNPLTDLWNQQSEWSQRTFGADSVRGPAGPLKHLAKETFEALESAPELMNRLCELLIEIGNPFVDGQELQLEEMADQGLLWLDAARRGGYTLEQLIAAMYAKQAININRQWGKAGQDDLVEHVK